MARNRQRGLVLGWMPKEFKSFLYEEKSKAIQLGEKNVTLQTIMKRIANPETKQKEKKNVKDFWS